MAHRIRVGAVNYLNSKPLVEGLAGLAPAVDLVFDLPSRLADRMRAGDLDVGLIPVIEYFRGDGYTHIPGISIASRGPVLSVTLFSRVPWAEVTSIALDEGSRTSAALTDVLSRGRYGVRPRYSRLPISVPADDPTTDAVLLIGDKAMRACLPGFAYSYDLGKEWHDWTGRPFVYAVWAVRPGVDLGPAEAAFAQAKRLGLRRAGPIAAREAPGLGLDPGFCRRYLDTVVHYDLGPPELAGLARYYQLAADTGLAPPGVSFEPYHRPHLVESR